MVTIIFVMVSITRVCASEIPAKQYSLVRYVCPWISFFSSFLFFPTRCSLYFSWVVCLRCIAGGVCTQSRLCANKERSCHSFSLGSARISNSPSFASRNTRRCAHTQVFSFPARKHDNLIRRSPERRFLHFSPIDDFRRLFIWCNATRPYLLNT